MSGLQYRVVIMHLTVVRFPSVAGSRKNEPADANGQRTSPIKRLKRFIQEVKSQRGRARVNGTGSIAQQVPAKARRLSDDGRVDQVPSAVRKARKIPAKMFRGALQEAYASAEHLDSESGTSLKGCIKALDKRIREAVNLGGSVADPEWMKQAAARIMLCTRHLEEYAEQGDVGAFLQTLKVALDDIQASGITLTEQHEI